LLLVPSVSIRSESADTVLVQTFSTTTAANAAFYLAVFC
jgi:hypothetical protein